MGFTFPLWGVGPPKTIPALLQPPKPISSLPKPIPSVSQTHPFFPAAPQTHPSLLQPPKPIPFIPQTHPSSPQSHPFSPAGPEVAPSSQDRAAAGESVTEAELRRLPEFNPPSFMPFGNVGTPLSVFLELIRACRLPPLVIKKLQLDFPRTGSSRRYGNVPFQYQNTETVAEQERVYTAAGDEITEGEEPVTQPAQPEEDEEEQGKEEEESHSDDVSGIFQHHPSSAVGAEGNSHSQSSCLIS